MPLFTKETAAINGRKGGLLRWKPKPPPAITPSEAENSSTEVSRNTLERFRVLDKRLAEAPRMPPDDVDKLTRSMERLWKIHAHAAQIPLPHPVKISRRNSGTAIDLEPFPMLPEGNDVNGNVDQHHDISEVIESQQEEPQLPPQVPAVTSGLASIVGKLDLDDPTDRSDQDQNDE